VQQLVNGCGSYVPERYPLSFQLWLSSVDVADAHMPADQQALAACESDRSKTDKALNLKRFITLPQPLGLTVADCAHATSAADLARCRLSWSQACQADPTWVPGN
jgi:hypothetical protein